VVYPTVRCVQIKSTLGKTKKSKISFSSPRVGFVFDYLKTFYVDLHRMGSATQFSANVSLNFSFPRGALCLGPCAQEQYTVLSDLFDLALTFPHKSSTVFVVYKQL